MNSPPVHTCALPCCEFCSAPSYDAPPPFRGWLYTRPRLWLCVWCAFDHYA